MATGNQTLLSLTPSSDLTQSHNRAFCSINQPIKQSIYQPQKPLRRSETQSADKPPHPHQPPGLKQETPFAHSPARHFPTTSTQERSGRTTHTNTKASLKMREAFVLNINLAPSYFPVRLPPEYLCRLHVSHLSSRWIRVGPRRHRHQERLNYKLTNPIRYDIHVTDRTYPIEKSLK